MKKQHYSPMKITTRDRRGPLEVLTLEHGYYITVDGNRQGLPPDELFIEIVSDGTVIFQGVTKRANINQAIHTARKTAAQDWSELQPFIIKADPEKSSTADVIIT